MKKLTIYVDMDGTIESLLDVWISRLNAAFGRDVKTEDVVEWDMTKAYPGLTRKEIFSVVDDSIWREVEPIEYADVVLKRFMEQGHDVYIVTAAHYDTLQSKMEDLLFRCFPFLEWNQVIITSRKQLLQGDVMIDDGLHNLLGGSYEKIVFDTPYNRNVNDAEEGLYRAYNWMEVEQIVNDIADSI